MTNALFTMSSPKTTIIIPTYNEAENIELLITRIRKLRIPNLDIIIIDDNSQDGTAKIVKQIIQTPEYQNICPIILIKRPGKLGLGSAYIAGFQKALEGGSDIIFEMDADGSHNPQMIPEFIKQIYLSSTTAHSSTTTAHSSYWSYPVLSVLSRRYPAYQYSSRPSVIIGSRRIPGGDVKGWNKRRNLQSIAASSLARKILRLKTKDVTSGFRCYHSEVLKKIPLKKIASNGYAFQLEILWWCERLGFKILEIPIEFIDRQHGKSKLSHGEITKFFTTLIRLSIKNQ